ncbi:benzoate/H(+) symporter BenE family transporter [Yoonia sp.]|uniref:benzoate/H(+) symporter BenE family transporter n=1 Tax=Yoonia sp. TaxID=2212373 RepID=UPI003F6D8FDD
MATEPAIIATLIAAFAVCTVTVPRYAVLVLLALAVVLTSSAYETSISSVSVSMAHPQIISPAFSVPAMLSLALPLLITTLSGQYLPGMAILRAQGYDVSANPIMIFGGIASICAAIFGGITTALASITAAFCAGPDNHVEPDRRYIAGVACGVFFCVGGVFAGTIVEILILLPSSVIALLAGLALLQPILKSTGAIIVSEDAQAGLLTFLFTASGVTLFGIGAAFWGARSASPFIF